MTLGEEFTSMNSLELLKIQKIVQVLNYFALKSGGKINKMKALKLVYFSDRYHLRRFGRFVSDDTYFAMDYGPVPSLACDIAKNNRFLDKKYLLYANEYIKTCNRLEYKSMQKPDFDLLSDSDIEAMDYIWDRFGGLDQFQLADKTHYYPEWKKHEEALKTSSRKEMEIADFINDPNENIDKIFELSEEDKKCLLEQLDENRLIESFWAH